MIDINKCYMDYVGNGIFDPKTFINARIVENRLCDRKKYKDPDECSEELYNDLAEFYNNICISNGNSKIMLKTYINKNGIWELKDQEGTRYGADYIGPSATGACYDKEYNSKIAVNTGYVGGIIKKCRVFGGHIIWPRNGATINTKKAIVNDRMDITLLVLRDWYKKINLKVFMNDLGTHTYDKPGIYYRYIELMEIFDKYENFLHKFQNFKGFCDYFYLKGSFVNELYQPIMFADIYETNKCRPYPTKEYKKFMKRNSQAIIRRNKIICNEYIKRQRNQMGAENND